jgi:hypothetical protein
MNFWLCHLTFEEDSWLFNESPVEEFVDAFAKMGWEQRPDNDTQYHRVIPVNPSTDADALAVEISRLFQPGIPAGTWKPTQLTGPARIQAIAHVRLFQENVGPDGIPLAMDNLTYIFLPTGEVKLESTFGLLDETPPQRLAVALRKRYFRLLGVTSSI